jgi:integrase
MEDVQGLVNAMLQRGYSTQAAKHVKTAASAIFTHAQKIGWFNNTNPAKFVQLPEMIRAIAHALSFEQVVSLLQLLPAVIRLMVFLAVMTSMNVAEICGLKWKRVNLTKQPVIMDAELLPPFTVGVREQWFLGQWGSVKARARRRYVVLPQWAVEQLKELQNRARCVGPEDPVFAGTSGRPLCANAIAKRHLKPAGAKLGMPWLNWHDLRRTFATLADLEKISIGERKELMGHSRVEMTLHYTHSPSEQVRQALEGLSERIVTAAHLRSGSRKVVSMRRAK